MRIGYIGFAKPENVDILVSPPDSVRYEPLFSHAQVLTTHSLVELRNYNTRADYAMQLQWRSIPERELSRLAFIPPTEVITLEDERGKEQFVVFNEPVRSIESGRTGFSGETLYSASMTAHPVTMGAFGSNRSMPMQRTLDVFGVSKAPGTLERDQPAPPNPTPANYSPILSRASSGLPPSVQVGEGVRFTFDVFDDEFQRGRYYSTDTDAYLELNEVTPQTYEGWYSNLQDETTNTIVANLHRYPFQLDTQFVVMALMWIPTTSSSGTFMQARQGHNVLTASYSGNNIRVNLFQGPLLQRCVIPFTRGQYVFFGVMNDNGTLYSSVNGGALVEAARINSPPPSDTPDEYFRVGGSGAFIDDLTLAGSNDVNIQGVYEWMTDRDSEVY